MTDLTCPKCLSTMKAIDRNGIVIERCESCGGVFLDKNELDQIIRKENDFVDQHLAAPVDNQARQDRRGNRDSRDRRDRSDDFGDDLFDDDLFDNDNWFDGDDMFDRDDRREHRGNDRPRRKKSFIEELFDSIT